MLRFLCYTIILSPLQTNSSPLISTPQNNPIYWPKTACILLKAANGTFQNMFHNITNQQLLVRSVQLYSLMTTCHCLYFFSFPELHGVCKFPTLVIFRNGGCSKRVWIVRALTSRRTPSPVMSMQKQMASCGDTWGRERTFPKLVLTLMRVPVCRLGTQVPRVISKRPMKKRVNFLSPAAFGPFGLRVMRLSYFVVMLFF